MWNNLSRVSKQVFSKSFQHHRALSYGSINATLLRESEWSWRSNSFISTPIFSYGSFVSFSTNESRRDESENLKENFSNSFINGTSSLMMEEMYDSWKKDPSSVHSSLKNFFSRLETGMDWDSALGKLDRIVPGDKSAILNQGTAGDIGMSLEELNKNLQVARFIHNYTVHGHWVAELDPLGLVKRDYKLELDPSVYGFKEEDMEKSFFVGDRFPALGSNFMTLEEIQDRMKNAYSKTTTVQYMHIADGKKRIWLREKFENLQDINYTNAQKKTILERLVSADGLEGFLAKKFTTSKRFGLEGGETCIPGLQALISRSADLGVENVVIGMPHRGRLNVLANIVEKPLEEMMQEFSSKPGPSDYLFNEDVRQNLPGDEKFKPSLDVKYHLGTSANIVTDNGKEVHISLTANPSHLEAVNPVVQGKTRAKQYYLKDLNRKKAMAVLFHGDAAFSGQGVVAEGLGMSELKEYTTGGTIHIIVNNQIGFTADPLQSRSSPYPSDVARGVDCPIFHVNGDDVETVIKVCELAAEYRNEFGSDAIIDIVCYRKFGHNEIDQPEFTQPLMYDKIKKMVPVLEKYKSQLNSENSVSLETFNTVFQNYQNRLDDAFENAKEYVADKHDWMDGNWEGFAVDDEHMGETGISLEKAKKIGEFLYTIPSTVNVHKQLRKILKQKSLMFSKGKGIDFSTAEALAFGSLLAEGVHVRLSGQDSIRGTFSHRHANWVDQKTGLSYTPLNNMGALQKEYFTVTNSPLNEFSVMGFEFGYSLENPNSLVMWEAQFGDFANCAQVIIDQFLAAGEKKWLRQSGLTLLLPHGYDGMGPEHSSARLERFLSLVDEAPYRQYESKKASQMVNIQVVNCTTSANYFHVLRRQTKRNFRKPLVIMTPKWLLRLREAGSNLEDFGPDKAFEEVYSDSDEKTLKDVKRVLFCSGQVYYHLLNQRIQLGLNNVAIVRIEQLAPFPYDRVVEECEKYNDAEMFWVSEEPRNGSAWGYISERFENALLDSSNPRRLKYLGRKSSAAPAAGSHDVNENQLKKLLHFSFTDL